MDTVSTTWTLLETLRIEIIVISWNQESLFSPGRRRFITLSSYAAVVLQFFLLTVDGKCYDARYLHYGPLDIVEVGNAVDVGTCAGFYDDGRRYEKKC